MKHENDYSIDWKLRYASGKLGLIPAFGDGIGKDVNKPELALAKKYVEQAADSHAALVSALEANIKRLEAISDNHFNPTQVRALVVVAHSEARAALKLAKGEQA